VSNFGTPLGDALKNLAKFELLQVGDTGHGKTTRALSATRFGPMYVFDFDGKIQGAARELPKETQDLIRADNYRDKDFDFAYSKLKELATIYKKGETPFATVVIDTFTMMNEKVCDKYFGEGVKPASRDPRQIWGLVSQDQSNFFKVLHSLPCNIIVNAHVSKVENAEGKQVLGISGKGSFRDSLPKKMTDSHYLYFDLGKWHIRCAKSATLPANSNIPKKFIDAKGNVTIQDLSIFDEFAYKVK
jgi:hypothetical protein